MALVYNQYIILAGGFNPSEKNMSSTDGIIIPNIWNNKIHVPNHQPELNNY